MARSPGPLRLRVQFTKDDRARFLSHSEYSRTLMISARRAGLPLEYAGHNMSRMKISLSPPLPIGVTSDCEILDFSLTSYVPAAEAQARFERALPGCIRAVRARLMDADARPVGKIIDTAGYTAAFDTGVSEGALAGAVERFLSKDSVPYERVQPKRTRTVDLRSGTHGLSVGPAPEPGSGPRLEMVLDDGIEGTVKPWEMVEVVADMAGVAPAAWKLTRVHRTGLFSRRQDRLISPMEIGARKAAAGRPAGGARY